MEREIESVSNYEQCFRPKTEVFPGFSNFEIIVLPLNTTRNSI